MTDMKQTFEPSELIINPDGTIFHLHLLPEQVADNVILVTPRARIDRCRALRHA